MDEQHGAGRLGVTEAMMQRSSVRAFRPDPVPADIVRDILDAARRAPSGGNLQPWTVHALAGDELIRFKALIASRMAAGVAGEPLEFEPYPHGLWDPFRGRRHACGKERYAAFGFENKDPAGLEDLRRRNFDFFGAPVGLFFVVDRRFGSPQWADLGMLMMSIMLLAVERGLDTCPQESWGNWNQTIHAHLGLKAEEMVFAGMALGFRDAQHPVNRYRTERAPFDASIFMRGF